MRISTFAFVFLSILGVFSVPRIASADLLQNVANTTATQCTSSGCGGPTTIYFSLGSGYTGTLTEFSYRLAYSGSPNLNFAVAQISSYDSQQDFEDNTGTIEHCPLSVSSHSGSSSDALIVLQPNSTCLGDGNEVFDGSRFYALAWGFNIGFGNGGYLLGANTTEWIPNICRFDTTVVTCSSSWGINTPYFEMLGISGTPPVPESGIDSRVTPADDSTVPFVVDFTGTYTNAETYTHIITQLDNITSGQTVSIEVAIPMFNGTGLVYSFSRSLQPLSEYQYRMRLWDSVNNTFTDWTDFFEFETTASAEPIVPFEPATCESVITDFFGCLKNFASWLFVPDQEVLNGFAQISLRDRFPFVYLYQVPDLVDSMTTGTGTLPTISITGPTGASMTLFSATMLGNVPFVPTIRTIVGVAMYIMVAFTIFRRVQGTFAKNNG